MILEQIADELVQVTSALVGGRTINIMNTDGVIIASTEKDRLGTVHYGARLVAKTGKTVNIYKEQLSRYPGSKEGCNMPIRQNGVLIGVVGIFGNPDEIQDLAHLLEVYTAKYFELESITYQRMTENELRGEALRLLVSFNNVNLNYVRSLLDDLQLKLMPPFRVIVVSFRMVKTHPMSAIESSAIANALAKRGLIDRSGDLYCLKENRMIFLKSRSGKEEKSFWEAFRDTLHPWEPFRISLGGICTEWKDIRISYHEACRLDVCGKGDFNDILKPQARCTYMMDATIQESEDYWACIYTRLQENFSEEELKTLLESAECYYEEEHSVSRAAARLFIHKNTLQYRLRRLLEALDLSQVPGFYQEYLVRHILQYGRNNLR
ncbi:MAG: CdaR family transcriptional regulator [Enterocloster sp.]